MAKKKKFYVVWHGRENGIFDTWAECQKQTDGFPGAKFMSFESKSEAQKALNKKYEEYYGTRKNVIKELTPEEIKKLNEMMMASRDISALVHSPSPFSYLFKGRLRNRQALVFDETIDAKKLFPENKGIEYGTFSLKIEHAKQ